MDLRKSFDYRRPHGAGSSPVRNEPSSTAHKFQIERSHDRHGITSSERAGRQTSPYQGAPYGVPGGPRPATAAYGGYDPMSGRIDDRHEELKRQIALKEKLLHDMTADRESTRRLRYVNINKGSGSINNTINRDQQSEVSLKAGNRASPTRGTAAFTGGFSGLRSTHLAAGGAPRVVRSIERADPGFETGMPARQQQLQIGVHAARPAFTAGGSPLRDKRPHANSKSRSRSKGATRVVEDIGTVPFTSSYTPNRISRPVAESQAVLMRPSGSPLRKSRSPVKQLVSEPSFIPPPLPIGGPLEGRDRLYRERIEAMTLDNANLQRRLNGVTADMQRAKLDVEGMIQQLRSLESRNDNVHRSVGHRDETDMANQLLQDELDRRREENKRMQDRIAEEQTTNNATLHRLDSTNMHKQNLHFESSNLGADLHKKMCLIEDLSRELINIQSKINMGNIELENLNRDDIVLNREVIDLSAVIGRIQAERQDAAARVHEITLTLDELLHNNESDRHQLELKRRWQSKLVTSRILEQMLMKLTNSRVNSAYQELREYAKFDKNCHDKLKAFAKVTHRLGLYRMRIAINRWYDLSLKPLAFISQNQDIALMGECNRLQAKCFYAWRQYLTKQQDRCKLKAAGADRMWAIMVRGSKMKKKRAMAIWKEGLQSVDQRMYKLRAAVRKVHEKGMRRAFSHWLGYSESLEQVVRMRVLHVDATQRLLLSQTFHQLKLAVHRERTMRLRKLRHTLKAWREYNRYNRHLMLVNMSAIQFVQTNQRYILKNCLDALRLNMETRKHRLLLHAVNEEVNPAIASLEKYSFEKSQQILQTNKRRACNAVKDQLSKRIFSYMKKWMMESGHYKIAIKSAALARLTRTTRLNLQWALDRWRKQLLMRETQLRKAINSRLGNEVDQNAVTAHENERQLRFNEECLRTAKRRLLDKTMRKFQNRRLAVALGRWMDICNVRTTQEDWLLKVMMRQRKRQLRAALDYYIDFLKWSRQHDRNMNGMLYLRHKANTKLMQRVYDATVWYTQRNLRARRYWTRILNRMDAFLRQRAINVWRENAGLSYENELKRIQGQQTEAIHKRNQLICSMEKHTAEQEDYIMAQHKLQRNKGYRQLGNYFVRTMQNQMLEKFRHWRQIVMDQKHKELVVKRTIDHWKRHTFHMAAMMFKKFVNQCHVGIYNDELHKKKQEQDMLNHHILFQKQQHDENVEAAKGTLQALEEDISMRKNMAAKLMHILERRNREWVFISRQRQVFNEWRKAVKQQYGFAQALESLLQKQLYMKGFHYIKNAAKAVEYETRVHRALRLYSQKRQKFNLTDAFNCWKLYCLSGVDARANAAILELRRRNQEHLDYVKLVKRTNMARVFNFLQDQNLANVWHAWRNVIKQLKQLKQNEREFRERQERMRKINVIDKWYLRKCATLKARAVTDTYKRRMAAKTLRDTFDALRTRFNVDQDLNNGQHRLEKFMRAKIFQDAFKNIKSYVTSKALVKKNEKSLGVQKIIEAIRFHYCSDLEHGWQQYKNQVFKHRRQKNLLKRALQHVLTWRKRMAFTQWRYQDNKEALCDDNYFIGPVRAEQWEASREIENLKAFMRHEQFDEDHIDEVVSKVEKSTVDLMRKYASRMRIKRHSEKRILPYCWDRWRKFVALRKLYRYKFRNSFNRTNNVRADLQYAFNRWKYKPLHLRSQLNKLSTPMLKEIALLTTKKVDQCSDQLYENQSISNHLMVQRDEFLNYYIKSQILAMALVKDRARNTEMQAWARWFDKRRALNKLDLMREIRDAAYLHANLKARAAELTKKNQELKTENVELTVFRDDAKVVKNNKDKLDEQNNGYRIKITETETDYERLVRENERLRRLVEDAEGATQTRKNRKYQDLYTIKYHDEQDNQEVENQKPAGERKEHLFTTKKEGQQYETEQERKNKERFANLAQKLAGASIR